MRLKIFKTNTSVFLVETCSLEHVIFQVFNQPYDKVTKLKILSSLMDCGAILP